jgi:hypothetical protein
LKALRDYQMLAVLKREVERYDSDAAAAKAFGLSRSHLSRVLRGLKPITARIAHAMGYEQQSLFVPYEHRR